MNLVTEILFLFLIILGLYQLLFSFKGLKKIFICIKESYDNDSNIFNRLFYLLIFYFIIFLSFISIVILHSESFIRLGDNIYKYITKGEFYLGINPNYSVDNIADIHNRILAILLGLTALFLPALFFLYTTFRKEIFDSISSIKKDNPSLFCKIEIDILKSLDLHKKIENGLRYFNATLFCILIIVLMGIFSINTITNINIRGDLTIILLTFTYVISIGYASLLFTYYRTVIPLYQKVFRWEYL